MGVDPSRTSVRGGLNSRSCTATGGLFDADVLFDDNVRGVRGCLVEEDWCTRRRQGASAMSHAHDRLLRGSVAPNRQELVLAT